MSAEAIGRRTVLKGMGLAALSVAGVAQTPDARAQFAVPNSSGTAPPKLKAPANACDCHHHIYDAARFPMPPNPNPRRPPPTNGSIVEFRMLQKRIGTTRHVVVQPRNYEIENEVTLDAL